MKTVVELLKASDLEISSEIRALMQEHDAKLKDMEAEAEKLRAERVESIKVLTKQEKALEAAKAKLAKAEEVNYDANQKLAQLEQEKKDFIQFKADGEKELKKKEKLAKAKEIAAQEKYNKIDGEFNRAKSLKEDAQAKLDRIKAFLESF